MNCGFLADENVPRICIKALRDNGYDVTWITEIEASMADDAVCSLALSDGRIILTNDKDFGDLVMRSRMVVPGVILLRMNGLKPSEIAALVTEAFSKDLDWKGQFAVITAENIRLRPLPS